MGNWTGGGIGRRRGLKILCPQGRVGSSPTRSTKNPDYNGAVGVFIYRKIHPLLFFSFSRFDVIQKRQNIICGTETCF